MRHIPRSARHLVNVIAGLAVAIPWILAGPVLHVTDRKRTDVGEALTDAIRNDR